MRRGKPQTLKTLDLAYLTQQFGKGEAISWQIWIGEIDAIGIYVLAEQGDFGYALVHQGFDFGQNVTGPTVFFLAAQGRHNAKSASVIAAHRN